MIILTKICEYCGKRYIKSSTKSKKHFSNRKYCSRYCANNAKVEWGDLKKECAYCGKIYEKLEKYSQTQWEKSKYCSLKCLNRDKKWTQEQKDRVSGKNHHGFGKHNSIETRLKRSESLKGEKAPNWQGGKTAQSYSIRHGIKYRLWREAIFTRDNWTCQKTGIRGEILRAHHIKNFAQFPELQFITSNGITFSKETHRGFHKKYGRKNNTKEQVEEFIYNNRME